MIQAKLKQIEEAVIWVNEEESLFKFPQSTYPDVGDYAVKTIPRQEDKIAKKIIPLPILGNPKW